MSDSGTCQVVRATANLCGVATHGTIRNVPKRTKLPEDQRPWRYLRKAIGLTQEALAERTPAPVEGDPRTYYNRLETGLLQATTVEARERLAVMFGLTVEDVGRFIGTKAEPRTLAEQVSMVPALARKSTVAKPGTSIATPADVKVAKKTARKADSSAPDATPRGKRPAARGGKPGVKPPGKGP